MNILNKLIKISIINILKIPSQRDLGFPEGPNPSDLPPENIFLLSSDIRSEGSIAIVKIFDFDFFFMIFHSTSLQQSKNVCVCVCVYISVCLSVADPSA